MGYGSGLGNDPIPTQSTVFPETHDTTYPQPLVLRGWCSAAPTDTTANVYAPGCELIYSGAAGSAPTKYVNTGTAALPVWTAQGNNATAKGLSFMNVAHAIYSFAVDGGANNTTITPASTAQIPNNAVLVGGTINPATAPVGGSVSVGVSAGLAAPASTKILGVTGVATLTVDAVVNSTITFAAPLKMTAAGNITFSITNGALTAGVIEAFVYYTVALNA